MNKKQRQLLVNLMNLLRRVPVDNFNMAYWSWVGLEPGEKFNRKAITADCDTSACAIGWGATLPSWQKEGFGMKVGDVFASEVHPTFKGKEGWNAVCEFLGITIDSARELFGSESYEEDNPRLVAAAIEGFIHAQDYNNALEALTAKAKKAE